MNYLFLLATIFAINFSTFSQKKDFSILGSWYDSQKKTLYKFNTKSVGIATESINIIVTYKIDWAKKPHWIDFTSPKNRIVLQGLLKVKHTDTIWIERVGSYDLYNEKPPKRRLKFSKDSVSSNRKMLILARQKKK